MIKSKVSLITNGIIFSLLLIVCLVCFMPNVYVDALAVNENVFYNGNKNSNKVSLMFNVYWGTDEVNQILDILDEYSIKCTFFLGGCWADDNSAVVKKIFEKGHELANHGYFHKEHNKLNLAQNNEEISHCGDLIKHITGYQMNLFAPPSGAYNEETISGATSLGYRVIMWSKDTIDWRDKDKTLVYKRATQEVKGGDLILMHPMKHTVEALKDILQFYTQNNLCVTTVTDNITT